MPAESALEELIAGAPAREKLLIELHVSVAGADPNPAQNPDLGEAAALVRLFVTTWDPFEWVEDRGPALSTTVEVGDDAEAVLYVPYWRVTPDILIEWASSMIRVVAANQAAVRDGSYAAEAFALRVPGLLSDTNGGPIDGLSLSMETDTWAELGHGALEDMAAAQYGPLLLDRTPVQLDALDEPEEGCVACVGGVFAFPAELNGNLTAMCRPHRAIAFGISQERFDEAAAASGNTWEALEYASGLLDTAHIPGGMRSELLALADRYFGRVGEVVDLLEREEANQSAGDLPAPVELPTPVELMDETADLFGRLREAFGDEPAAFESAVADDIELIEEFLDNAPALFRAHDRSEDALAVADMLCDLLPSRRSHLLVGRAEAKFDSGDDAGALADLEAAVDDAHEDDWIAHASAASLAGGHGYPDRADKWYRQAVSITQMNDEISSGRAISQEYLGFLREQPGRELDAARVKADLDVWDRRVRDAARGMTVTTRVGRNDPCTCGSGKKSKHCCAR